MAQYLKNYPKSRLLGIAHEQYVADCENYDTNNITKYKSELIKHPINDEFSLKIEDATNLPEIFLSRLVSQEQMQIDGWFDYPKYKG
jgi:hypothetical protein